MPPAAPTSGGLTPGSARDRNVDLPRGPGRPRADWLRRATEIHRDNGEECSVASPGKSATSSPAFTISSHTSPSGPDAEGGDGSRTISSISSSRGSGSSTSSPTLTTLNVDDLLLLHHYLTVTAATIGQPHIWRDGVPRLGRDHPGILHAMLAISAYHLERADPKATGKYLNSAERHHEAAIRAATTMMSALDMRNCQAFYSLTTLICFTAFAKGPGPGDLVLVSKDGRVSWIYLMRGVRMVLETFGSSFVLSGVLDPEARSALANHSENRNSPLPSLSQEKEHEQSTGFYPDDPSWDWHPSLERLAVAASQLKPDLGAVYRPRIQSIRECFEKLYGSTANAEQSKDSKFICVMAWAYSLDEPFLHALDAKHGVALVLVGFFAVLLRRITGYWWLDGWGDHVLGELKLILGPEYHQWLP